MTTQKTSTTKKPTAKTQKTKTVKPTLSTIDLKNASGRAKVPATKKPTVAQAKKTEKEVKKATAKMVKEMQKILNKDKKVMVSRMEKPLADKIFSIVKKENTSVSEFINRCVLNYFEHKA